MKRSTGLGLSFAGVVAFVLAVEVPDWHAPVAGTQTGPAGTSMVQFAETSPWRVAAAPAEAEPDAATGGPAATDVYKDVQVLTDVSAAEFDRLQRAMTTWVSPKAGCGFCHAGDDFAAEHPMKTATREMIRMTRHINVAWRDHVGEAGATCFTCHRGEPVPPETWLPRPLKPVWKLVARSENWNEAADTVRKFFPDAGWALYFLNDEPIRVESKTAMRGDTVAAQVDVKRIYEMMMQMSDGIGVNCGYCHNSRAFSDWSQSTPARWFSHDAFRMMRDLNGNYMFGAGGVAQTHELAQQNSLSLPPENRGPTPGPGLANCATCHYGHLHVDAGAATIARFPALASAVNAAPTQPGLFAPPRSEAAAIVPASAEPTRSP